MALTDDTADTGAQGDAVGGGGAAAGGGDDSGGGGTGSGGGDDGLGGTAPGSDDDDDDPVGGGGGGYGSVPSTGPDPVETTVGSVTRNRGGEAVVTESISAPSGGTIGDDAGDDPATQSDSGVLDDLGEQYTETVAEPVGDFVAATSPVAAAERATLGTDRIGSVSEGFGEGVAQIGNVPGNAAGAIDAAQSFDRAQSRANDPVTIGGVPTGLTVPDFEGQERNTELAAGTAAGAASAAAESPFETTGRLLGGAVGGAAASRVVTRQLDTAGRVDTGGTSAGSGSGGSSVPGVDALSDAADAARSRAPDVSIDRDPTSGPVDINTDIRSQLDGVTDRLPSNEPAGDTAADVFGTAGRPDPGPTVRLGPSASERVRSAVGEVSDRLPSNEPAGDTAADVFGTAGRPDPGPTIRTGSSAGERIRSTLDDVTPSNDPAGDTNAEVFGTAGRPDPSVRASVGPTLTERVGSTLDEVTPSNAATGDSPSDIFGTARGADEPGVLDEATATAGDTPSDIFGTARGVDESGPLAGVSDRLPSNDAVGDTPSDIFGTAPESGTISDLTLRIGEPDRPTGSMSPFDDGPDADGPTTSAGPATIDVDTDADPGQAGGMNQITQLRLDRDRRTETDTDTVSQQPRGGPAGTVPGGAAGIGINAANDPTGIGTTPTPTGAERPDTIIDNGDDTGTDTGPTTGSGTDSRTEPRELLRATTGVGTQQTPGNVTRTAASTETLTQPDLATGISTQTTQFTRDIGLGGDTPTRRAPRGEETEEDDELPPGFGLAADADVLDSGIASSDDLVDDTGDGFRL